MAIGWLTIFKAIPWSDVVAAAPTVVKGARKLVDAVRKRGEGEAPGGPADEAITDPAARLRQMEARIEDLEARQQAALALVESMAEQQQKLVAAVEVLRLRSRFLLLLVAVLALGVALALAR